MQAAANASKLGFKEHLVVLWGLGGVLLILSQAVYRLTPLALEPFEIGMTAFQTALYFGWIVVNGYAEGYRGFQKRFSPRVVQRAFYLAKSGSGLRIAFAPLFCMSFFHASKRGKYTAWGLLIGISLIVAIVRALPQPWRGIIDGGVVVGLGWGMLAVLVFWFRAVSRDPGLPPDLPEAAEPALSGAE